MDCSVPRQVCPDDYNCLYGTCIDTACVCDSGWTGDDCSIGDFFNGTDSEFMFLEISTHSEYAGVSVMVAAVGVAVFGLLTIVFVKIRRRLERYQGDRGNDMGNIV